MNLRTIAAAALVSALAVTGCAQPAGNATSRPTTPPSPPRRIVFDMGHGEIFSAVDTSELGQSRAVERMKQAGFEVVVNQDAITPEDLADASGLIIPGPMRPLQNEEYAAISQFVKRGGTAVLTIHVPFPVLGVPSHWGLPVQPVVMESTSPLPGAGDPSVFVATAIEPGPLTQGVSNVLVVSGWPVRATSADAELLVSTDDAVWADGNRDNTRTADDPSGPFGVVGAARVGKGYVVVLGDDAIFANIAIDQADNGTLLENVLTLMEAAPTI